MSVARPLKTTMTNNLQRKNDILQKELQNLKSLSNKDREGRSKAQRFAEMMIAPGEVECVKAPSKFPARSATRHFTRTFTLAANGANSAFGIKLNPDMHDFYSYQSGSSTVSNTDFTLCMEILWEDASESVATYGGLYVGSKGDAVVSKNADGYFPFNWTTTKTGTLNSMFLQSTSAGTTHVTVRAYHTAGFTDFLYGIPPNATKDVTSLVTAGANTWTGIGLKCDYPCMLSLIDTGNTSFSATSLIRPLVEDKWLDQGQVSKYRVTAMSLLASYRGNLIENSGVIAALRAPRYWNPGGSNLYDSITRIPDDEYHGPLLNGAYVWWMPQDLEEMDFRGATGGNSSQQTSLYIGGVFGDADSALEVTIDVIIDFYSPLQIFERKIHAPFTDITLEVLHDLSLLPAATCNPSHLDLLKKGAKKVAHAAKGGIEFVQNNPELLTNFYRILALLA